MNVLEMEFSWLWLVEIYINEYIIVVLWYVYFCLFVYHFFMQMFVVILSSTIICKQVCLLHCFVFVAYIYNLNVQRCKSKTPVSGFLHFHNNMYTTFSGQIPFQTNYRRWIERELFMMTYHYQPKWSLLFFSSEVIKKVCLKSNREKSEITCDHPSKMFSSWLESFGSEKLSTMDLLKFFRIILLIASVEWFILSSIAL